MKYNTQLTKLILPEYGRNIHNMVNYCVKLEDKEERTHVQIHLSTLWAICFHICVM